MAKTRKNQRFLVSKRSLISVKRGIVLILFIVLIMIVDAQEDITEDESTEYSTSSGGTVAVTGEVTQTDGRINADTAQTGDTQLINVKGYDNSATTQTFDSAGTLKHKTPAGDISVINAKSGVLNSDGTYSFESVSSLETGNGRIINAEGIVYDGVALNAALTSAGLINGGIIAKATNLKTQAQKLSISKAQEVIIQGTRFSSIGKSDFVIESSRLIQAKVRSEAYNNEFLIINPIKNSGKYILIKADTGQGFDYWSRPDNSISIRMDENVIVNISQSDKSLLVKSKDNNATLTIIEDAVPRYKLKNAEMQFIRQSFSEIIQAKGKEAEIELDFNKGSRCITLSNLDDRYFYKEDKDNFGIHIIDPKGYTFCTKRSDGENFSNQNVIIPHKSIILKSLIELEKLSGENANATAKPFYRSSDPNNKLAIDIDKGNYNLKIENFNPKENNVSFVQIGHHQLVETKNNRYAKISGDKVNAIVTDYTFRLPGISFKDDILIQKSPTSTVTIYSPQSQNLKNAEQNFIRGLRR